MTGVTFTLLENRPDTDSATLVVSPKELKLGWLEGADFSQIGNQLADNLKRANLSLKTFEAREWRTFVDQVSEERVHPHDRILSVTTNSGVGFRLALILYSKRPKELMFIEPRGVHSPRAWWGLCVGVVSGLPQSIWQAVGGWARRLLRHVIGSREQRLYAVFIDYPRSVFWLPELMRRSLDANPQRRESTPQIKKVIHINNALAPGGAERQFVNTVIGLKTQPALTVIAGFLRLFHFEKSDFYLPLIDEHGIDVVTMDKIFAEPWIGRAEDAKWEQLCRWAPRSIRQQLIFYTELFRRERPDVVHLWQDETSLLGGLAAIAEGVPRIVLSSRNLAPYRFAYYRLYWKRVYRALAAHPSVRLINNSQAGAADYVRWLDVPPEKFSVLRNGVVNLSDINDEARVDPSASKLGGYGRQRALVGSIFRFWPEKDPMLWLEVVKAVINKFGRSDIDFLIVGDGPMRGEMSDFISENNLTEFVTLYGITEHAQELVKTFDLFMLTSKAEGTPNVIIEAQAAGVPVVTTEAGGAEETVQDGVTGWVVRERSPRAIAKTLVDALDGHETLQRAGLKAPQFVLERFGVERMIRETMALYE